MSFGLSNLPRCPFTIAIDTREQRPFSFTGMRMPIKGKMAEVEVETAERCLGNNSGDYACEGIDDVRIERKSLEDLYGTLANREAFREQIEYMNFAFRFSAVVVEASWGEVCDPSKFATPLEWKGEIDRHPQMVLVAEADENAYQILRSNGRSFHCFCNETEIAVVDYLSEAIAACERRHTDETWRSQLHPQSVTQTILSWSQKFPRVHWLTPGSRRNAEVVTFDILRHAYRHSLKDKKHARQSR